MPDDPSNPTSEPDPNAELGRDLPPLPGPQTCVSVFRREQQAVEYRRTEGIRACARDLPPFKNQNNGEEQTVPRFAASHTKGFLHDATLGEIADTADFQALRDAVISEDPDDFDALPVGPGAPEERFRYVDPQGSIAFDLEGPDPASPAKFNANVQPIRLALAPTFASPEFSAEMGEVYLQALLREVPLRAFIGNTSTNAEITQAVAALNTFFTTPVWPVVEGTNDTTPGLAFRGLLPGDLIGPYLSQFLIIGSRIDEGGGPASQFSASQRSAVIPPNSSTGLVLRRDEGQIQYGTITIDQRVRQVRERPNVVVVPPEPNARLDFMTSLGAWLNVQDGLRPTAPNLNDFTGQRRFVYSGRQLANWVHFDQNYQAYYNAALLILGMQERAQATGQDLFNAGNPYPTEGNQEGFGTFGNAHVLSLLAEGATRAIKASWYEKWFNQRRIRPEAASRRVHESKLSPVSKDHYDINDEILDATQLLAAVFARNEATNRALGRGVGTYLLPQAFPEGSPLHPSLPSGHATIAGTCVTILKALFNGAFTITGPRNTGGSDPILEPNDTGTGLVNYTGSEGPNFPLRLDDELNKLASNVALGRNFAGVHYRSDATEGLLLGEYVAVGILQEQARSFNPDHFYQLTLFGGRQIRILRDGVIQQVP